VGTRCADHVTPLYPQKLALTLPTDGGRSVGIVRVRTKATEFFLKWISEQTSLFYNRAECLLRGTDWVFKCDRPSFVLKGLMNSME